MNKHIMEMSVFMKLPEYDDYKKIDGKQKFFLFGERIIEQKANKKPGDIATIYEVIKVNKKENMVYYAPKTIKLT